VFLAACGAAAGRASATRAQVSARATCRTRRASPVRQARLVRLLKARGCSCADLIVACRRLARSPRAPAASRRTRHAANFNAAGRACAIQIRVAEPAMSFLSLASRELQRAARSQPTAARPQACAYAPMRASGAAARQRPSSKLPARCRSSNSKRQVSPAACSCTAPRSQVRYSRVPGVRGIPVMPDPTGNSMRSISKPESGSGSSLRTLTWPRFVVFRGDQRHSYKNVGTERHRLQRRGVFPRLGKLRAGRRNCVGIEKPAA
jgi:hypothetical protein